MLSLAEQASGLASLIKKKIRSYLHLRIKDEMFNIFLFSCEKIKEKDEAENVEVIASLLWFLFLTCRTAEREKTPQNAITNHVMDK